MKKGYDPENKYRFGGGIAKVGYVDPETGEKVYYDKPIYIGDDSNDAVERMPSDDE